MMMISQSTCPWEVDRDLGRDLDEALNRKLRSNSAKTQAEDLGKIDFTTRMFTELFMSSALNGPLHRIVCSGIYRVLGRVLR